jgi:hypothetical protein
MLTNENTKTLKISSMHNLLIEVRDLVVQFEGVLPVEVCFIKAT